MGSEIGMTNVAFPHPEDYRDVEAANYFSQVRAEGGDMDVALRNMHIQGRDNVRVPMQWNGDAHAGFTPGTPWIKVNPNYPEINVAEAEREEDSVLHYFRQLIQFRKNHAVLRQGDYQNLDPDHEQIYAYARSLGDQKMIIVCNFSDEELEVPPYVEGDYVFGNYDGDEILRAWEVRVYHLR